MTLVQDVVSHAQSQYGVLEVAMAMPRGSKNYGLYRGGVSDIDYTVVYLPYEHDLYVRQPLKDRYIETDNFEYKLVDIRNLPKILKTANLTTLDFIWAEPNEEETAILEGFDNLDIKMFLALEWVISYNLKSFYFSHISQTKKALHEYREKGHNYKTSKRLITASYLLWVLNTVYAHSPAMDSADFMVLMHSAGKWHEYPNPLGELGDLSRLKFDLGEEHFLEFVNRVDVLLTYCEDIVKTIPDSDKVVLGNTLEEVENVLVASMRNFYYGVDNNPQL